MTTTETEAVTALVENSAAVGVENAGANGAFLARHQHGPGASSVEILDAESLMDQPRRLRGTTELQTEASFGAYVLTHKIPDSTAVFADRDNMRLAAVINGHKPGGNTGAQWQDRLVELQFEHGRAWERWTQVADGWRNQDAFIDFLEDRIADVVDPPETALLEIVQTFSASKSLAFSSARNLANGQVQLEYRETVAGSGGAGNITVPERITLALDPIKGDAPYDVKARLRWRITDGNLQIMVKLDRLDDVLEHAWGDVIARVSAALQPVPVYEGRP